MKAIFKIGDQDFTHILVEGGLRWSRNDLDAEGAGRSLDGVMQRKRVAVKRKLAVSCLRLDTPTIMALNQALYPQFVRVTFLDPVEGITTRTFYGSTVEAATQIVIDGETYWEGTSFNLIER